MTRQLLAFEQIKTLCEHMLGVSILPEAVRELTGGTFNLTYSIALPECPVVLRVAPADDADSSWDDEWLMQREYAIQPWLAAIAPLTPKIIAADFTHRLIDRDYMFQTLVDGQRWEDVADELTEAEQDRLWQQFGFVTRQVHDTVGDAFGSPYPGASFTTWSAAFMDRLSRISGDILKRGGDIGLLAPIRELAGANRHILDQIQQPHLLHGDLWLFNLLIKRYPDGATITGVLDADRAWWGDPMADWTMFILSKSESDDTRRVYRIFWDAYGPRDQSTSTTIRMKFYEAMNAGSAFAWAIKTGDDHTSKLAIKELRDLARSLAEMLT